MNYITPKTAIHSKTGAPVALKPNRKPKPKLEKIKFPFRIERGITGYVRSDRPLKPYYFREYISGKSEVSAFKTKEELIAFAKERMKLRQNHGVVEAQRFNKSEADGWKFFRSTVGYEADLKEIAECWLRHGKGSSSLTVSLAVEKYLAAKEAENISPENFRHQKARLAYLTESKLGNEKVSSVTREDISSWLAALPDEIKATQTKRDYQKNVKSVFTWLQNNAEIKINPLNGLKLPKLLPEELKKKPVLKPEEAKSLFEANLNSPHAKEVLGRLALEAFAGIRYTTVSRITSSIAANAFNHDLNLITLNAEITKNRSDQSIDNSEQNLWLWLKWSEPHNWKLSPRNYLKLKSECFIRANVPHPKNVLRKSFATHHLTKYGDSGKTANALHHTSFSILEKNYRSLSLGKPSAIAYFKISPLKK